LKLERIKNVTRVERGVVEMKSYRWNGFYIPEHMMSGIKRYVEEGILPGHFLQAIISNDLFEACAKADDDSIRNLPAYVAYFYNETPMVCWGSKEKMYSWCNGNFSKLRISNISVE